MLAEELGRHEEVVEGSGCVAVVAVVSDLWPVRASADSHGFY